MGVLSVAQICGLVDGGADEGRQSGLLLDDLAGHPRRHGDVIGGRVRECVRGQLRAPCAGEALARGRVDDLGVHGGVGDDCDARVVLRRRAHHRRPSDVDLLDAVVERRTGRDCLRERIQVDDDQVERLDAQFSDLLEVLGLPRVREDPCVDARMQRLHTAFEGLREAGELLHRSDGDTRLGDAFRRRTGRYEGDAGGVEALREALQAGLVIDADKRAADGSGCLHVSGASCSCGWVLWSGHGAGVHPSNTWFCVYFVPLRIARVDTRTVTTPQNPSTAGGAERADAARPASAARLSASMARPAWRASRGPPRRRRHPGMDRFDSRERIAQAGVPVTPVEELTGFRRP